MKVNILKVFRSSPVFLMGTVIGPLMFLCHINDLPDCVKSQSINFVSSRITAFYIGQLKVKEINVYYRMTCVN